MIAFNRLLCWVLSVTAVAYASAAEPFHFTNVLYGAAYYHEYMPYDRLDKDVALMKQAGLSVVRMGESTWSLWEPQDGRSNMPGWIVSLMP